VFALSACLALPACGPKKEEAPSTPPSAPSSPGAAADASTPVAKIGGDVITEGELHKEVANDLKGVETQIYAIKQEGLRRLIEKKLIDAEAKSKGMTADALLAKEVAGKVATVTDDDAKKFYVENKDRIQGNFDQLKDRIKQFLQQRNQRQARDTFVSSLRKQAKVAILLEAPRVEIPVENSPVRGNASAPITIVEFSDFQCPFCRRSQASVGAIKTKYPTQIRWVFKDFPLSFHQRAMPAAMAARCAGDQGKYWEYHDKLFNGSGLEDADLKRYAKEVGLDESKFDNCVAAQRFREGINADMKLGQSVGVSGTPAFFINGRMLSGAQPPEAFQEIIDEELSRKNAS
jgi:protein-disulfide isomerase